MLRMNQFKGGNAKAYYTGSLSQEDYYTNGLERVALWRGEAARIMGLTGEVTKETFSRLADNLHPIMATPLTPRTRDDRTCGYDLNFHVPKGVSVLHALSGDERIVEAIRDAVHETMKEIERQAQTRVRLFGEHRNRPTGNLVWGEFLHTTTRPVDGIPDPHRHVHCFVFNATFDPVEERFKAGQFRDINRDMPYYQAAFDSRLASTLDAIGYATEHTHKGWDLAGVPESLTRKFSRRTQEIEDLAARLGVTDAASKAKLGARTRTRKLMALDRTALVERWSGQVDAKEREAIELVAARKARSRDAPITAREALDHAIEHRFTRESAVPLPRLLEKALQWGLGQVSPEAIKAEAKNHPDLITAQIEGQTWVTSQEALREERAMLTFAREGRGSSPALLADRPWQGSSRLNDQQREAVKHILTSQDRVMLIRGGAGTGKTTLMKEAVAAMEARGKSVTVVAPTSEASRTVLRQSGFPDAETLQMLLTTPLMQHRCRNGVIWCDEAGLVGSKEMQQLFQLAGELNARVILSGDTRQHASVGRGDAMRLLETHAGLRAAEVLNVVRQQGTYKEAVEAFSTGRYDEGIKLLDKLQAIQEIEDGARQGQIAQDYVQTVLTGRSCLVVAPTHAEGELVSGLIRAQLKREGLLSQDERLLTQHKDLGWTSAQKREANLYLQGQVVRFHRQVKGFKLGEPYRVLGRDANGQVLVQGVQRRAKPIVLPLTKSEGFSVMEEKFLPVAAGERVRFTRNGRTRDNRHRLNNGGSYKIAGFTREGDLKLDNGWVVHRDYGHIAHAYTSTSHAAQGKSVDQVLISQGWNTLPAASAEQMYVSISRGKQGVTIYTDDRQALVESISKQGLRKSATEVVEALSPRERLKQHAISMQRLRAYERARFGTLPARSRPGRMRGGFLHGR